MLEMSLKQIADLHATSNMHISHCCHTVSGVALRILKARIVIFYMRDYIFRHFTIRDRYIRRAQA